MTNAGDGMKAKRVVRVTSRESSATLAQTPGVGIVVTIVERFNLFRLFALAQVPRVTELEEARSELDEPFRVDRAYFAHVFFCRENELVVDDPVGLALEQGAGGMDVRGCLLDDGLVTFLRILLRSVEEESGADGLAHFVVVPSSARCAKFVTIHDGEELLSDVLRALQ